MELSSYFGERAESEAAVEAHMQKASPSTLLWTFLSSPEFGRLSRGRLARTASIGLDAPKLAIDTHCDDATLKKLRQRISKQWAKLGSDRPHWSVLTGAQFLPENFRNNEPAFWASGEREVDTIERLLDHSSVSLGPETVAAELGCGVGRVTIPLSQRIKRVVAYDISEPHLDLARQRARAAKSSNIEFRRVDPDADIRFESCDLFYSRIVLQHNTPPIIRRTLDAAFASIQFGGVALFQVPTYRKGYSFSTQSYLNSDSEGMEMNCLSQAEIFSLIQKHHMSVVLVREDDSCGRDRFVSNTFLIKK